MEFIYPLLGLLYFLRSSYALFTGDRIDFLLSFLVALAFWILYNLEYLERRINASKGR